MDKTKQTATGKSDGASKVEQPSADSKDAVSRRRDNVQMIQNGLLIWLDNSIGDNNTDYLNTITQLRQAVNTINTFTDGNQCIQFLDNVVNEKICLVISGSLGQHIVPRVHNRSQVDSIFIFCGNKERHEQCAKEWSKIKGIFTNISPICETLKQTTQQCEQNAISISFMATSGDVFKKKLNQLNPSFIYTQILKEILMTIDFKEDHIKEFIKYCRDVLIGNEAELINVEKLERKYRDETPIWWYTCDCFLYTMLNRALRCMNVDVMTKIGFFIRDLYRHIEQLHSEQFGGHHSGNSFTVYHGQAVTKTEFKEMTKTKGGLISFNSFLSTSKNRNVSLDFANSAVTNPDLVGILFVMTIDPAKSTAPFASITDIGYFGDKEDEILFAMNSVFRIYDITPIGEKHRLFQVELTLTNDNDLRALTDHIREKTFPNSRGWYRFPGRTHPIGSYRIRH